MRTFADTHKATQQAATAKSTMSRRVPHGQGHDVNSRLHLQRTTGNQDVQQRSEENAANVKVDALSTRFEHDFSRIPVHHPRVEAANGPGRELRTYRMKPVQGSSSLETTVLPPEGVTDEEVTVPGGGGSASPAASSFCQATPISASIENVKKYTNGKLYGHEFDFVVGLEYSELDITATKDKDCTFEWWEKTTRPPAWQTVIKANTWNDMYALYPTSPTFDGWTKNRAKTCPGSEAATVHDVPGASVDLPARTLWFDLKVTGGGTTKSATGTQVLEPDGKGGIKTQTFSVP